MKPSAKAERARQWQDYCDRGPQQLADLMMQSDDHVAMQAARLARLREINAELVAALKAAVAHVESAAFRDNVPWLPLARAVLRKAARRVKR